MADCDITVCAELQRGKKEMRGGIQKEEADEGENKNTTKKGLREKKIWKKEITEKIVPILN
jgi:hypothetical protein